MILSNVELHAALDSKRLIIDPEPRPRQLAVSDPDGYCPFDTHSVDLTLGNEISIPESGVYTYDLTEKKPKQTLAQFLFATSKRKVLGQDESYVLERNHFILAQTHETVGLPIDHPANRATNSCLAARIEGKSSRARIGLLIHFTAPTVHPGFSGRLTLEMINLGPVKIILKPGMAIAQLIVEQVKGLPTPKASVYQGQMSPVGVI